MIKYKGQISFELNVEDGDSEAQGELNASLDKDRIKDIGFDDALMEWFEKIKEGLKSNNVDKWIKK